MLKISGAVLLFLSIYIFSLTKTNKLKQRASDLLKIRMSVEKIKNSIRIADNDVYYIFSSAFKDFEKLEIVSGKPIIINDNLRREDFDIIYELFNTIGSSDIKGECEKIEIYESIINKQYTEAKREYETKNKIYKTFGFCGGLAMVIMII